MNAIYKYIFFKIPISESLRILQNRVALVMQSERDEQKVVRIGLRVTQVRKRGVHYVSIVVTTARRRAVEDTDESGIYEHDKCAL